MQETLLNRQKSQELFYKANQLMPGGVNSPVRAFGSIDGSPLFIKKAKGPFIWDEDDNKYIDFVGSWGPMILGHADPDIEAALLEAIQNGTSFGAPTAIENEMAEEVIKLVPSIEKVRMVNSGTEATMSAIRLARAYTTKKHGVEKNKILKFTGCYHGHVDALLVQAGSGVMTLGLPDSPGVTKEATANTILLPFNEPEAVEEVFDKYGDEISALVVEPIFGNCGMIKPQEGFLEFLRDITLENDSLLIFDEVMTGFRVSLGGAQEYFGVTPDITCLGKVIGGGLPVGAYGASEEIMSMVAPEGPMYQAGTLSGNPLAMAAGLTCLRKIQAPGFFPELENKTAKFVQGLKEACHKSSNEKIQNAQFCNAGGMFGFFFTDKPIKNYEDAAANIDTELFKKFYLAMLESGVYLAPSAFEAGFVSGAHLEADLDTVIERFTNVVIML